MMNQTASEASGPYVSQSLDSLLAEAKASGLAIQNLCENYWSEDSPRWTCWLHPLAASPLYSSYYGSKGTGQTAGSALRSALDAAKHSPLYSPELGTYSFDLPSLDSILPSRPKVEIVPGAVRRFRPKAAESTQSTIEG